MEKITDINIFFDKLIQRRLYILDKKLKSAYRVLFETQKEKNFAKSSISERKGKYAKKFKKKQKQACKN